MIRNLAKLAAAAIAAGIIVAAAIGTIGALILNAPMASERKLATLWVLACAVVVAAGVVVFLAVQRHTRARRAARKALRDACTHHRQPRVLHGPLLVFGQREGGDPIARLQPGQAYIALPDDTVRIAGAADLSEIPQQRRPRPRPEGDTK